MKQELPLLQRHPISFPSVLTPGVTLSVVRMELLEPGIVAGSYVVKMGGFKLSSHVSPCSETCYNTSRIKMPKEPLGGSEAFLCISNQSVIFSHFLAKLSRSQPGGLRRCGYKALQNPALLLFLSKTTHLFLHTFFYLHLRLLMKANYRAEQGSETILFPLKSVGSLVSPASAGLLTNHLQMRCLLSHL